MLPGGICYTPMFSNHRTISSANGAQKQNSFRLSDKTSLCQSRGLFNSKSAGNYIMEVIMKFKASGLVKSECEALSLAK